MAYNDEHEVRDSFHQMSLDLGAPRAPRAMRLIRKPRSVLHAQNKQHFVSKSDSFVTPTGFSQGLPSDHNIHQSRWAHSQGDNRMADVESRPDYGRGGGYRGGGGNNRKRSYRDDSEYDRRPQRRRYEEPLSVRVRRQVTTIAESPLQNADEDVISFAKLMTDNYDDAYFLNNITDFLPQFIIEQPLKIPFVAAILLNANKDRKEFTQTVLEKTAARAQGHLENGEWRSFKLVLRFLACTQGLFDGDGVFGILEELFNRAVDLQTASSEDTLGLELVKIIMLTIPYALIYNPTAYQQQALELLEKTDIIASSPHALDNLVDPYISTGGGIDTPSRSLITLLQKQLQQEAEAGWPLAFMVRPFKANKAEDEMADETASSKHVFPTINVPETIYPGAHPIFPEIFFSLYADQDIETVPSTSVLACSLIRDSLVDTINILDFNRHAAAKFLVEMDCYWSAGTFLKRATPFDKVKEAAGDKSTWKPEDLAVDAIFSQMMRLPMAEHKLVYYHSMITETCKIAAQAIAPSLGRAIRFLYKNLDITDAELNHRYMDWFAHHLSNFDYRWKWTEWVDDVNRPDLSPKKAFILGALDKEIRLAFASRIRSTLPEEYHPLIPQSRENDIPEFKYNNELTPHSVEGKQLLQLLKRKAPEADIQAVIDAIHSTSEPSEDSFLASTDAYITAICYIGSKSLSHVLSYIERCKEHLLALGPAHPEARSQIISSVVGYWSQTQPGVAVNIVDKLLNYTILTPSSVIEWALATPERLAGGRILAEAWVYEMVARTVAKVTGRVRQIVAARMQKGMSEHQISMLDDTLNKELADMRSLFVVVEDALVGVAEGSASGIVDDVDVDGPAGMDYDQMLTLKTWGVKWLRTFRRKLAVEENVVSEAMRVFPPASEEVDVDDAAATENGNGHGRASPVRDADGDEVL